MTNARRTGGLAACASVLALLVAAANASAIIYQPSRLDFEKQRVKKTSPIRQVDVGGGYCGVDIPGPPVMPGPCFREPTDFAVSGPFRITSNTCPSELSGTGFTPQYSCSVGVAFRPRSRGKQKGFLRIASSPSIVGVPLIGQGCKRETTRSGKKKTVCKKKK